MKRHSFWISCLLLWGVVTSSKAVEETRNVIGVIYDLVGDQSSLGIPSKEGFELAFDRLSQSDDQKIRLLKMLFKDGKSTTSNVASQARLLASMQDVAVLIGLNDDDLALAAGREAEKAQKVFISSGATSPILPTEVPQYLFLVAFGDNAQAAAAAEYAYGHLKWKTASILYHKDMAYTRLLAKYFMQSFSRAGGEIVSEEHFPLDSMDIDSQLKDIKNSNPEFIYLAIGPEEVAPLIKKMRAYGLKQPIFGGDSFDTPSLPLEFSDVYFTTHVFLDLQSKNPLVVQFMEDYKKKYNKYPENAFAALAYDSCNLFADVLKRARSAQTKDILDSLNKTVNFLGVTGKISYSEKQHVPIKPVTIVSIQDGKKVKEEELVPQHVPLAKGFF